MDSFNLQKKLECGVDLFNKNLFDEALLEFKEILKLVPFQIDALHWIGCINLSKGDVNSAINYLMEALIRLLAINTTDSNEFKSLLLSHLGRAHHLNGNFLLAKMIYDLAKECGKSNATIWEKELNYYDELSLLKAKEDFEFSLAELMITKKLLEPASLIVQKLLSNSKDNQNYKHYFAVILHLQKKTEEAEKIMRETIIAVPESISFKINYANVLKALGRTVEAKEYFLNVLSIDANNSDALNNLGNLYLAEDDYLNASECYEKALKNNPLMYQTLVNLGTIELKKSNFKNAENYYLKALEINSMDIGSLNNLSVIYKELGDIELAVKTAERVLSIDQLNAEAWTNLGNNYRLLGKVDKAEASYAKAYEIMPNDAIVVSNYGNYFGDTNRIEQALVLLNEAIKIDPKLYSTWNNLGAVYLRIGRVKEASKCFLRSFELNNQNYGAISNYLLSLNYTNEYEAREIKEIHELWCEKLFKVKPLQNIKKLNKKENYKIKIGFVSSDFRRHSVALFLYSLYENIDRDNFEIYSYSSGTVEDEYTEYFQKKSDCWHEIYGMGDQEAALSILGDEIDVLFDVGGFTNNNRLGIFSYKPAPIQATWMGYVATTGLSQMDFRIVDWNTDPLYRDANENTEMLIRLSRIIQCYSPTLNAQSEEPKFPSDNTEIIFGCFNNYAKITKNVLSLWGKILSHDQNFKLYLKSVGADNSEVQDLIKKIILDNGGSDNQLMFNGQMNDADHLKEFAKVHIALDPFPFNGATTTFETLYMGVPVIALEGKTTIGRISSSILRNLDMSDWIAVNEEEYVKKAIQKAYDINGLEQLRKTLRNKMENSVVMDQKGFSKDFESCIYQMYEIKAK